MQFKYSLCLLPIYGMLSLAQRGNLTLFDPFFLTLEQGGDTYFLQVAQQDAATSESGHLFHVAKTGVNAPPSTFTLRDGVLQSEYREARRLQDDGEGSSPKFLPFLDDSELGNERLTLFESFDNGQGITLGPVEEDGAVGFVFENKELFISVSDNDEHITLKVEMV